MLKLRIAFLAWLLVLAVVIEAGNRKPGTISRGLTGLGIQVVGKGILMGKLSTIALKIILADAAFIHPQAQALVADELHNPDCFIDSSNLLLRSIHFVLIDQHQNLLC